MGLQTVLIIGFNRAITTRSAGGGRGRRLSGEAGLVVGRTLSVGGGCNVGAAHD